MEPGTSLGPYRIECELGAGGMGTVYRAEGPEGVVALKVVHPHLLDGADAIERFRREVEIGCAVDHPNVVRTLSGGEAGGEAGGRHFLAMEYVEGQTLDALLVELDRVPEDLCRHIGREVCKGLSAIHAAGAIHRDMKPENVLITPDHVVKIMDLGVARSTDDALRLSQTGAFVGSLQYAAPEQFTGGGKGLDGRVDLHALGLVLYELATGVCPFRADDIPQTVRKVLHEDPRRLGEINPQLSAFFEEAVHCLLAKDRDERFATADELHDVLDVGEDSSWWHARARALQQKTRRPIRRVRIPRETAVYGRDAEVATLRECYERAKAGDGNVVLIEGEAGIGKSRLVDELIGTLQRDGEDIDFVFGSYPPGGAATASGAFATAYREQFGPAGSGPYLPENQVLVPAFDALLRGDTSPPDAEPLTKDSLQTCFVRATQAMSQQRVLVVLIDDLHFAPEEGRALFTSIAMAVPGHRVLLIGTTRPGVPEDWLAGVTRLAQTSRLALKRLGPKDLVQLLKDTLQSEQLAGELSAQIAEKSDGNPFFVFEIIRGLREGQFITQKEDGSWVSTQAIDEIQIPASVMDLIQARIADLSEEQKELLDVAACCGFAFDPRLVAEVVGLRRIPALRLLGGIEKSHRLVRSAGRDFTFDHHQVQEALYEAISGALREEYHAAIAESLESLSKAADQDPEALDGALCVELCEHYLKGARGAEALRYLEAAEAHLTKAYLHAQGVALSERALAIPDLLTGTERVKALLRLAAAVEWMGRRARQEECAQEAERLAEEAADDELRGEAANALGWLFNRTSRQDAAEAAFRRALEIALARGDKKAEALATGGIGNACRDSGRPVEAREHMERALALSREIGNRVGEAAAMVNLGNVLLVESRFAEAREHLERGLALCREIGHRQFEANAEGNLGNVFSLSGSLREGREHHERCLAISREMGNRPAEAMATGNLGWLLSAEGRMPEAQEHAERHLLLSREVGHRAGEAVAEALLASVLLSLGRLGEAREHAERHLLLSREVGDVHGEVRAEGNLGTIAHSEGRLVEARQHFERCLALAREIGDRQGEAAATGSLGNLSRTEGRLVEARELLERNLALAREMGDRMGEAVALVNLGPTWHALGDRTRTRTALEASLAICRASGLRYPEGYGLLDLGRLADEEGDGALALQLTEESLTLRRDIRHSEGMVESLIELGDLCARAGNEDASRAALDESVALSRDQDQKPKVALAQALLACVSGGDAAQALPAIAALRDVGEHGDSLRLRWLLFRATGDRAHLDEAKHLLDESLAKVPQEYHEAMLTNLRVNREIVAAWKQHGRDASAD